MKSVAKYSGLCGFAFKKHVDVFECFPLRAHLKERSANDFMRDVFFMMLMHFFPLIFFIKAQVVGT